MSAEKITPLNPEAKLSLAVEHHRSLVEEIRQPHNQEQASAAMSAAQAQVILAADEVGRQTSDNGKLPRGLRWVRPALHEYEKQDPEGLYRTHSLLDAAARIAMYEWAVGFKDDATAAEPGQPKDSPRSRERAA